MINPPQSEDQASPLDEDWEEFGFYVEPEGFEGVSSTPSPFQTESQNRFVPSCRVLYKKDGSILLDLLCDSLD